MSLAAGTRLGPYEILAPLGTGGMGEVYRARDSRLDRDIALKVLPVEWAVDSDRLARFEREAKTVAALNHPNIVTVHSVDEVAGVRFITMEVVEGTTLANNIPQRGLSIEAFLPLAIQVADALASAHARGVIHRDLKPGNVMVTGDGRVKVLDFGLAKLSASATAATDPELTLSAGLTYTGQLLGTAAYMSPEQAEGREVDARSDVFALGAVLYEMATGRPAFDGASAAAVISAILRDTPPAVSDRNRALPVELSQIIQRCLQKEPEKRYASAAEVHAALRALQDSLAPVRVAKPSRRTRLLYGGVVMVLVLAGLIGLLRSRSLPQPSPPMRAPGSIAVLPFVNMSADADQEFFSEGVSEELTNLLARIPELRVTSRASAFSFKGKEVPTAEIARQLQVAHLLGGSVRKAGNKVRVAAQLIDTRSDTNVWSRTYDRTLEDIFAIQDEIAADVVRQLRVTLFAEMPTTRKTNPEAYALYLRGLQLSREATRETFAQADAFYRQALAVDPRYAPAWLQLSRNASTEGNLGMIPHGEAFRVASEAAARALEIDDTYAPVHARLGFLSAFGRNDLVGGAAHLQRACDLDPDDLDVLADSAFLLQILGRGDEATVLRESILSRDPLNAFSHYRLALSYLAASRFEQAIVSLRTALRMSPERGRAHYLIGKALLFQGQPARALEEFELEKSVWRTSGLPLAYFALGRKAESDAAFAKMIELLGSESPYEVAAVAAYRGETDQAFAWLEKAAAEADGALNNAPFDPLLASLRTDPRWQPFLKRTGHAPEQLAAISFHVNPTP